MIEKVGVPQGAPPSPLVPESSKTLKLLDIEPLELARQLTIMESQLYQRITPMDCLRRARKQTTENIDNIAVVIQTSNKVGASTIWLDHNLKPFSRSLFGQQNPFSARRTRGGGPRLLST